MLTIRMQRTGRKGLANFRVVVQDSRFAPNSGRIVAQLGHYNPHTKETVIDKEKAAQYLKNGAQPSPRVATLLQGQKVSLPEWVEMPKTDNKRAIRNPEKLRKNQPKQEASVEAPAAEPESTPEASTEEPVVEATSAEPAETETPTEEKTEA